MFRGAMRQAKGDEMRFGVMRGDAVNDFGDSPGGLTGAQLARIVLPQGQKAQQLATGEVVPIPEGTVFAVR